jgi:myo-inositol-1(or 4)-monophosphatase
MTTSMAPREVIAGLEETLDGCRLIALGGGAPRSWTKLTEEGRHEVVTEVDVDIEDRLSAAISRLDPAAAIISEEAAPTERDLTGPLAYVIDPIDGTDSFLSGSPDYCICIGVLRHGMPLMSLVDFPAQDRRLIAVRGEGLTVKGPSARPRERFQGHATVAMSTAQMLKPQFEDLRRRLGEVTLVPLRGTSAKIAAVATGEVDAALYIATSARKHANVWDFLAAGIALEEAGGCLTDQAGAPLLTGRIPWRAHGWIATREGGSHSALVTAVAGAGSWVGGQRS